MVTMLKNGSLNLPNFAAPELMLFFPSETSEVVELVLAFDGLGLGILRTTLSCFDWKWQFKNVSLIWQTKRLVERLNYADIEI